jgi:hypothetical protein
MATCKELKAKFIDYLIDVDLDTLDVSELNTFACIIKTVNEMENGDYYANMIKTMSLSIPFGMAGKESENDG